MEFVNDNEEQLGVTRQLRSELSKNNYFSSSLLSGVGTAPALVPSGYGPVLSFSGCLGMAFFLVRVLVVLVQVLFLLVLVQLLSFLGSPVLARAQVMALPLEGSETPALPP